MSERYEGQTYYDILEISPTAGPTEIYNAYQRARSTYSPKSPALYSMFTPEEAQQLMALIDEAYACLSHQARRKEYDSKLGGQAPKKMAEPPPHMKPMKRDELPKGFARTKFSVYEVKPAIEEELQNLIECDGLFLQKVRLYRGVTLDQMADAIRATKSTLVALEANDIEALPVAVFTRGFVVQYTRALALDEKRVTDAYMKYFRAHKN